MAAGGDAWPSKNLDEEVANYLLFVGSIDRTLGVQVAARSQEGDGCRIRRLQWQVALGLGLVRE